MVLASQKLSGAYYTPDDTVAALVKWAIRSKKDRLLDPSCGDGRFLAMHRKSVGVEQDSAACAAAMGRAPWALIHDGDFFRWAAETPERFECAAGNPPFIRYQNFTGDVRDRSLALCRNLGIALSGLASSWVAFVAVTASLLKLGGRMAFVVPAEIGHAPYARPLLQFLVSRFSGVQLVAVRKKLFPELSEDCWLLYAEGYGGKAAYITLSPQDSFIPSSVPPERGTRVSLSALDAWDWRLRPFLLPARVRDHYRRVCGDGTTVRLREVARVGIGYVTGANDFFHLRPSEAAQWSIPDGLLHPAVRNGRSLAGSHITPATVTEWLRRDEKMLLLKLEPGREPPKAVRRYLDSSAGEQARETYKCRMREPWYSVPDVTVPDAFIAYMSGGGPALAANRAGCVCTNSVHAVRLSGGMGVTELARRWKDPFTELSCEVEGHPLGGGMLKLEPREAGGVALRAEGNSDDELVESGIATMREWRHCG